MIRTNRIQLMYLVRSLVTLWAFASCAQGYPPRKRSAIPNTQIYTHLAPESSGFGPEIQTTFTEWNSVPREYSTVYILGTQSEIPPITFTGWDFVAQQYTTAYVIGTLRKIESTAYMLM
jgi:hypothetical protein